MRDFKQHTNTVENIKKQMKVFFERKQKVKIYHGSTNSTRAQKFEEGKYIDISELNQVIEVNTNEQYVLVEPNVSMDRLIEETLRYNLVPQVVMEFPGITVGGGIQGGAGESSSFKYGLFHDTCLEYEVVLGNGEVIITSPTQNKDLFYGTACSYGSLGIITLVKLRLIVAKKFVHLTYHTVYSLDDSVETITNKTASSVDFVDGIIFNKNRGTVMTGTFSNKKDLPKSTFGKRSDEWFYLHADKISQQYEKYEEIIPIKDYLFRYNIGGFWVGYYFFTFFKIPFTKLTRYLLYRLFNTRTLYRLLHSTNISQEYFVQDLSLPKGSTLEFLRFVNDKLHIYPLWLCPLQRDVEHRLSPNYLDTDLVINVGVWGRLDANYIDFVQINRNVEDKVAQLHARKVLYAHAYYSSDKFWEIYDHPWYIILREKYFANLVFPDIYKKIKVTGKYKKSILLGILRAMRSSKLFVSKK